MQRCIEAGTEDALDLPGLKPERRAVLGGGLSILYTLAVHFGIERLQPARGALRQGVIFDLAERLEAARDPAHHDDMRDAGVRELQQRFDVDPAQARRVQALALDLMRRLDGAPRDDAARLARRELGWAAALHEVGMLVSHHDHHRHSAYLLAHADAAGFSQSQQRRLADLVLAQRGGLRKVETALADPGTALAVMCLRLAVLLSHARADVALDGLRLRRDGNTVTLTVPARWQRAHPRSAFLLREEAADWARVASLSLVLAD
jgi:exopolyphosphatase/guanosine-5'-triphosphate,3'-diphosphate pyrophosphatase